MHGYSFKEILEHQYRGKFHVQIIIVASHRDPADGVSNGFSNPIATATGEKFGLPLKYNALADEASWAHMQLFFKEAFSD